MYVTHKAFDNQERREAGRRVLVVFSDLEEDSERDNFLLDNLTASRIEALLNREQRESHLPDLRDTDVWIAGATPDRTLGPANRYGPALLNFALSRKG